MRTSHTDVIIIAIMMIKRIIVTPTLPSQDQEKAPVSVQRACRMKRQPTHKKERICNPNRKVLSYIHLIIFPSLLPSLSRLHLATFPTSLPWAGSALPLHYIPHCFPTKGSVRAVVAAGERPSSTPPQLFGGEPALQVSAQNKHSWLSYEPPEG